MDYIQNKITSLVENGVDHYQSLDANLNRLKRKCEELNCRKKDVESQLKVELMKAGKKLKEEVNFWFATVQRINEETQSIFEEKQSIENRAAPMRIVPGSRLGKLVVEKIQEVEEHHQKGSFSDGLVVDESPSSGLTLPTTTLAGETTAKKNMKEIWDCLMNDEIRSIGVYGLGGIGKTTIMKHIYNKLLKETDKFDNVFWVTVSKGVNVVELQDAIASALIIGLSRPKCETTRAAELFDMLRGKKRYVLILDDVWEAFELENVGVPEPTLDNGCKIVLTTRSLDVCRRMNCKSLKMELLSEEEAWNLFLDKVGRDVLSTPGLEPIMKLVAKECACLPLAVVTIGGSMKGVVDEREWRNVLKKLCESIGGLNDMGKVIEQLKCSCIRLKDEKLQQCLLHCALFPEDSMIRRVPLIQNLFVVGIIGGGTSRRAKFDKGHSLLHILIACAKALSENRMDDFEKLIEKARAAVSISGEPIQRLGAYLVEGLVARKEISGTTIYRALGCRKRESKDLLTYMEILYGMCPYSKFGYMAANGAIAEACRNEDRIHIVDFQIGQGSQWITLLQALAARQGGAPHVRITAIDDPVNQYARGDSLEAVGRRLAAISYKFNIPVEFHPVPVFAPDITRDMLDVRPGEALAVNFPMQLHHTPDESVDVNNPRDELLRMIKSLSPKVTTLVEQESSTNTTPFVARFVETLEYYSAVFESIDVTMSRDRKERIDVEQHCLARDIVNIIACEGKDRVERHDLFGKWKCRLTMAGFRPFPLSSYVNSVIRSLLQCYSDSYTLVERDGAMLLGWKERNLVSASAWH